jgi:hypothetical protein
VSNANSARRREAAEKEAYRNGLASLTMQARKLEGRWICEEAQLECQVLHDNLAQPDILLTIYDYEGRQRASAEVHLQPAVIGALYYSSAHKFTATVGLNKGEAAPSQNGSLTIDPQTNSFTFILYQPEQGAYGLTTSVETLRATFRRKPTAQLTGTWA